MSDEAAHKETLIELTSDIVAAHVGNNQIALADLPRLIESVYEALANVGQAKVEEAPTLVPAVPIRTSVKPDFIYCLEDGKKLKTLKRHLSRSYGLSPEQYRARWNLPADYPMVAPNYAAMRRELAKKIGLGRKPNSVRGRRKKLSIAV